jgi:glucose-6-phosphate 1-dehydrogenase
VRIGLEKPLGTDLGSSRDINDAVAAAFPEDRIFRIDHYLGKETVQNLLALRFANMLFEPLWNAAAYRSCPDHRGRNGGAGRAASAFTTAPARCATWCRTTCCNCSRWWRWSRRQLRCHRDPRRKGQGAARAAPAREGDSVTGQYRAGAIGGQPVPGYDEELGKDSDTETFVAIKAHIDNWRWKGVPFYLRTGKRLPERKTEIVVQFRRCRIRSSPERARGPSPTSWSSASSPKKTSRLTLMAKVPGLDRDGIRLREVPLDIAMADAFAGPQKRIAYERLLLDLIEGDQTLFVRRDEVEAQWDWIDAIRASWADHGLLPKPYTAPEAGARRRDRAGRTRRGDWHE